MSFVEWSVGKKLFKNANHAIWFLMSLCLLVVTSSYYVYPHISVVILLPIIVHASSLVQAIWVTHKKRQSEIFSKDCIWFNAILVAIYLALFFISLA